MCYDIAYFTKKIEKYEQRFGVKYGETGVVPVHHVSGFAHTDIPVVTGREPDVIQMFTWGLIPFWVKDFAGAAKIQNRTLNARDNTLFEKPSFREAAKKRRCLVIIDGFYDHHWHQGKSYPFFIKLKSDEPFALGGIWETWKHDGEVRHTVSVVTTDANGIMTYIHNNPKASETPRMPFIVPLDLEEAWLNPEAQPDGLSQLIGPYPDEQLDYYTVPRLRGKAYPGNVPEMMQPVEYDELNDEE